jgi:hypothetical protein
VKIHLVISLLTFGLTHQSVVKVPFNTMKCSKQ